MVSNHGDCRSPKWGYSPYKWPFHGLLLTNWDDPPSIWSKNKLATDFNDRFPPKGGLYSKGNGTPAILGKYTLPKTNMEP